VLLCMLLKATNLQLLLQNVDFVALAACLPPG
jgi:hypothetical protein